MSLSIMTLSTMAPRIMTLSIAIKNVTLSIMSLDTLVMLY
jgi:hypothetical protein